MVRTALLFLATAVAEIIGCYTAYGGVYVATALVVYGGWRAPHM